MNFNSYKSDSTSNKFDIEYEKAIYHLDSAKAKAENAQNHALRTTNLVIQALKKLDEGLRKNVTEDTKGKLIGNQKKIEKFELLKSALLIDKKTLQNLDLFEKIYKEVKEIKQTLDDPFLDINHTDLDNQWKLIQKDHEIIKNCFLKAKNRFWDLTQGILSSIQEVPNADSKEVSKILDKIPKEKIKDFTSLKKALKDISSVYKLAAVKNISDANPTQKPTKLVEIERPTKVIDQIREQLTILPISQPKEILPLNTLPEPSDKLFLHYLGDPFGGGTGLEGESMSTILHYAEAFLSKINPAMLQPTKNKKNISSKLEKIIPLVQGAIRIQDLFNKQMDRSANLDNTVYQLIKLMRNSLESHGSVLIPGGWVGIPSGHAMYYEVKKQPDGTFTYSVYNRGAGLSYHDNPVEAPHKLLYPAFMEYENISEENLFNPRFLRGLVEFNTQPRLVNASEYDIYEGLFPLLKGNLKKLNLEMEDLMSSQHSGTCTWKSFCAFMRAHLSYGEYKLFTFRIKQQGLWDYYQHNHDKITSDPKKRNLFEKGRQSFARSLKKIGEGGLISSKEYQEATESLKELNENIALHKIAHLQKIHQAAPSAICEYIKLQKEWKFQFPSSDASKMETTQTCFQTTLPSCKLTNSLKSWEPIPGKFSNELLEIQRAFTLSKQEEKYDDICSAFSLFMEKIPLPDIPPTTPFWKAIAQLPPKDTLVIMKAISEIHDCFFKSSFLVVDPNNRDPRSFAAIYKGLTLQDALINLAGAENLGLKGMELPPDFNYLSYLLGKPTRFNKEIEPTNCRPFLFPLRDPKIKEELIAIHDYFNSRAQGVPPLQPLPFYQGRYTKISVGLTEGTEAGSVNSAIINPELAYIREFLKDETFVSKIKKYIHNFDDLKPIQKIGIVYTLDDPNILPESFLLYRRQVSQIQCLTSTKLKNPKKIHDVDQTLTLNYTENTKQDSFSGEWETIISKKLEGMKVENCPYNPILHSQTQVEYWVFHEMATISLKEDALKGVQNFFLNHPHYGASERKFAFESVMLFTNPEVQITEILAYMIQHSQLLKDSFIQSWFENLFFEGNLMLNEMRQNPEFLNKISDFINKSYFGFCDQGDLAASTYLLNLARNIQKHKDYLCEIDHLLATSLNKAVSLPDYFQEAKKLLKMKSLTLEDKSFIYSYFIDFCSDQEKINESTIQEILIGISHLIRHPLPLEWRNPATERGIRRTLQNISEQLSNMPIEKMNDILNAIVNHHYPTEGKSQWTLEKFPLYTSQSKEKTLKIDILQGNLFINEKGQINLPSYILENESYNKYFDKNYTCKLLDINRFEFTDGSGHETFIEYDAFNKDIKINKIINGQLYEAIEKPYDFPFESEHCFYRSKEKPLLIYACDKVGKECYCLHFDDNKNPIKLENLLNNPILNLVNIYEDKVSYNFLKAFEKNKNILVWESKDKNPQKIELPRFDLSFTPLKNSRAGSLCWECQQIKGFFLSEKQFIEPLAKLDFTTFLKLENSKGEIKVLIPRQNLNQESQALGAKRNFDTSTSNYLIYGYDKQPGRLERELKMGVEEGLYMALLALSAGSDEGYRLARHLLDPSKLRIGRVRLEEIEILEWLCQLKSKNHDHDPRAIALRLHSLYLLNEQIKREGNKELISDKEFWKSVMEDLSDYANTLQHCQGYHLPTHELTKLCELVIERQTLPKSVVHLLQKISPDTIENLVMSLPKFSVKPSMLNHKLDVLKREAVNLERLGRNLKEAQDELLKNKEDIEPLFTRNSSDSLFFLKQFSIAVRGSNEKKQALREILQLQNGDLNDRAVIYSTILKTILDHPGKFKLPNSLLINWDSAPAILGPIIDFAIKEYEKVKPEISTPQKEKASSVSTLRPKILPEAIKLPGRIPETLFGDTLQENIQIVQEFNPLAYLEKTDEKIVLAEKINKETRLNIIHKGIQQLLDIPTDRVGKKVIERLQEGCITYLGKQKIDKDEYHINLDKLGELETDLDNQIAYRLQAQQQEAVRLCALADIQRGLINNPLLHNLQQLGGIQERFSIDDLCLLYAKGILSSCCGGTVEKDVKVYLESATLTQKLERSLLRVKDLQKNLHTDDKESAEIALVTELTKSRIIDPDKYPACLVLEYFSNILMHQGQYDNMKIFLETGKELQPIRHMIMGSGKTSVLMRLLALLRADGERISILVLTDELLESMSEEVRSGIVGTFDQFLVGFEINRNTDLSLDNLKELKDKIERCRKGLGALMMSPKSIHTFYLIFLETCFKSNVCDGVEKATMLEKIGLQRDILGLFGKNGSALLDEADILLNCRTEVNFPFGDEKSMPDEEQNLLLDLYEVLLENPEVTKLLKFDFRMTASGGDQASLYNENSFKQVKLIIVDAMLKKMDLGGVSSEKISLISTYLLLNDTKDKNKEAEYFISSLKDKKLKNTLALLKEELNGLLPITLQKNCGEHYGYSLLTDFAYAIPAQNGKPIEGSRISNVHENGNCTIQTVLKFGIREKVILDKLNSLQKISKEELQKGIALKETTAYKEFLLIVENFAEDFHLSKLSDDDKKTIIKIINDHYKKQRCFLKSYILPTIPCYTRKLNSNAHMLARFFHNVLGFSGTLWNADTYPNKLSPQPEHDVDAMSLFILSSHLTTIDKDNHVIKSLNVISIDKSNSESVLKGIQNELSKGTNVVALADNGGYLNEENADILANKTTKMLHQIKPSIKGTAYFNSDSTLVIKEYDRPLAEPLANSTLSKENRFTIYGQPFTTGTDVKQAPNGVALVTIGRTSLLRDLFQTVWRMREIDRGQRIKYLVANDIEQVIRKKIKIPDQEALTQDHLLRFCLINQIAQLSDDTVVATKQKMLNLVQWQVLQVLLDPSVSNEEASNLFADEMKDLFSPSQATTAYELYGKVNEIIPTDDVMQKEKKYCLSLLKAILDKVPFLNKRIDYSAVEHQLDRLLEKELLPESALSASSENKDQRVQVQQKQRTQEQQMVQQQEAVLEPKDQAKWQFIPWPTVAPEEIFNPNFYNTSWWGSGYKRAASITSSTASIPAKVSKYIPAAISDRLPTKNQALGLAAAYLGYQYLPFITMWAGVTSVCSLGLSRVSYTMAAAEIALKEEVNQIYKKANTWIADKILPLEGWADGAPLPYCLSDYLKLDPSLIALEQALDPAVTITHNFAPWKAYNSTMKVTKPFQFDNKSMHEMLLIQNKGDHKWQVVIIDKEEAKYFRNQLIQDKKEGKAVNRSLRLCLYNPIIGVIQTGSEAISDHEIQKDKIALKLIVQAKFFNGEKVYTDAEFEILKGWIADNNPNALKEIFQNRILPNRSDRVEIWDRMKKLFPN
jgi:hypothetical protein